MSLAWLLRSWLTQQAQANLRQQVHAAVQEGMAAQPGATPQPDEPRPPCDVGLVFALSAESGGTEDLLAGAVTIKGDGFTAREGRIGERQVVVVQGGAGREKASRATQALIRGHRPAWVISAGFAGGLTAGVKRGDILMANEILDISGRRLAIDVQVEPAPGLHVGRLLTVDRIIARPEEKATLGQQHAALAVDMESWAVGEICRQDKVRFLSIRIISDAVDDALPDDLGKMISQQTTAGLMGAAAGTIFRRPGSVKDMLRLREEALIATDRLAKFLAGVIAQLGPS